MHWLDEETLRHRVRLEAQALSAVITNYAGLLALQIGTPELELVPSQRFSRVIKLSALPGGELMACPEQLPVATATMDLVLMVHTLERAGDIRKALAEAARILKGEGVLVVTGFRLGTLLGLREWPTSLLHKGRFVSLWHLRWLVEGAGLEWQGVRRLPVGARTGLPGLVSGSYAAVARKRIEKPIVFRPQWTSSKLAKRGTVPEARHAS